MKYSNMIGKGTFGQIYTYERDKRYVVKIQKLPKDIHEIQLSFKESSIQKCITEWQKERNIEIVPEYVNSKTIKNQEDYEFYIIMKKYDGSLKEFDQLTPEMSNQLKQKLKYIHNLGYVHRDIKLSNIFWRKNDQNEIILVYGDLGLAREATPEQIRKDYDALNQILSHFKSFSLSTLK